MSQDNQTTPEQIQIINDHLDALLGMDARKPGTAATLPAVIKITETLEPAGGKEFPVFPPSYAGEGNNAPPVYDLNGIEWGEVSIEKSAKDGTKRITRHIKRARHCTMDSPQSHANRTEIAFRDDPKLRDLVPQAEATIPRKAEFADQATVNLLALPHRVADFRVRASKKVEKDSDDFRAGKRGASDAEEAIKALAGGDALPLLRLMPTSLIFGFWDSRAKGYQHKHARILLTRIDAFGVVPCQKHSVYTGPYSKDECASIILEDEGLAAKLLETELDSAAKTEEQWAKAMAARGFSSAPASGLGGVLAEDIKRLALISLTDIASIFCKKPAREETDEGEEPAGSRPGTKPAEAQDNACDRDLTNAARRYLLALALLAENYPRSTGSYRLRSGCELLPIRKDVALVGAGADSEHARALIALCGSRDLLARVARAARDVLLIPTGVKFRFEADKEALKADLEEVRKKKPGQGEREKSGAPPARTAGRPQKAKSPATAPDPNAPGAPE